MKDWNRVIPRHDIKFFPTHPSSWDDIENDLSAWALFVMVEDSVMRITYIDKKSGMIKYDWLTSTDLVPHNEVLDHTFKDIIFYEGHLKEHELMEKEYEGVKPWKFIRR